MIELTYNEKSKFSGTLCLGFFDCVHLGHIKLIEKAKEKGDNVFVFTFSNDLTPFLHGKNGYIYSYVERLIRLDEEGVLGVVDAEFGEKFMNLSREDFLDGLFNTLKINKVVCGSDYTFGKGAEGDTEFLIRYFNLKNIQVDIIPLVKMDGIKASTTYAKELLLSGEIEKLNKLLVKPYRVSGIVKRGNKIGQTIGFPTANIEVPSGQTRIKEGVYAGYAHVLGKRYKAIINAGGRPTVNSQDYKIESFLEGDFGELYGEQILVEFIFKIRDIQKFNDLNGLKEQLKKDIKQMEKL